MERLSLHTLRHNAYRVLGLTARATQADIDNAARMMRLWGDDAAPPTPNDAAWLGPVKRTPRDIEHAVMRLNDPEIRPFERLWWFCDTPPEDDAAGKQLDAEKHPERAHDIALARWSRAVILGANEGMIDRWYGILKEMRRVARSDSYLQWSLEMEDGGDFEKRASAEEQASMQLEMAAQAGTLLAALADELMTDNAFGSVGSIVSLFHRLSHGQPGPEQEMADRLLDRLEDELRAQCITCVDQINEAWKTRRRDLLKRACARVTHHCEDKLAPLFQELIKWSIADEARVQRVRIQVVDVYAHAADAYEACLDKYTARATLMKSLDAAATTHVEPKIRQRIETLTGTKPPPIGNTSSTG